MSVNYYNGSSLVEVPGTSTAPEKLGFGYATCTTAAATAAKVATMTNYVLKKNGFVAVKFTYGVPAAATLNINSKGAKPIYRYGSPITNKVICAGDLAIFVYDGTNYNLVGMDSCGKDLKLTFSAFNALPQTINDPRIKADMICDYSFLTNSSAQTSDWSVNPTDGSVTVSGSINGQTELTIKLSRTEEVS